MSIIDSCLHTTAIKSRLEELRPPDSDYAIRFVDGVLAAAVAAGASDVHLQPTSIGLQIRWRIDGVLQSLGEFPQGKTTDIVTRLKVLAELLTYQSEVPQEGRLAWTPPPDSPVVEMRLSTFPTIYGERAVVRTFSADRQLTRMEQLGLPRAICETLQQCLLETSGAILITGPASSGKTTTAYACLRHLVEATDWGRSIATLEDPVEVPIDGVVQSQINTAASFSMPVGLRSLLRQDPEVILIGEIRDRETAQVAMQAAMTGQLMLSTFHAGSAVETISRLAEMEIEPYLLKTSLLAILSMRLVRRVCDCAEWSEQNADRLQLPTRRVLVAQGCDRCRRTGYAGRAVMAELLQPRRLPWRAAMLGTNDADRLEIAALDSGMQSLWESALKLVESGETTAAELRRVLGWSGPSPETERTNDKPALH